MSLFESENLVCKVESHSPRLDRKIRIDDQKSVSLCKKGGVFFTRGKSEDSETSTIRETDLCEMRNRKIGMEFKMYRDVSKETKVIC